MRSAVRDRRRPTSLPHASCSTRRGVELVHCCAVIFADQPANPPGEKTPASLVDSANETTTRPPRRGRAGGRAAHGGEQDILADGAEHCRSGRNDCHPRLPPSHHLRDPSSIPPRTNSLTTDTNLSRHEPLPHPPPPQPSLSLLAALQDKSADKEFDEKINHDYEKNMEMPREQAKKLKEVPPPSHPNYPPPPRTTLHHCHHHHSHYRHRHHHSHLAPPPPPS